MDYSELMEWVAYYKIEPWGSDVEAQRHAMTAYTTAKVGLMTSGNKKPASDLDINDFMVCGEGVKKKSKRVSQTPADHFDILSRMARNKG